MENKSHILVCTCSRANLLPAGRADEVLALLNKKGITFSAVSDLCGIAAKSPEKLKELGDVENLLVIACYPRSIKWILHRAGIDRSEKHTKVINMRTCFPEETLSSVENCGNALLPGVEELDDPWQAWYPVIDYDRCTACGQCADFCLFGVYEKGKDGRVKVVEPANCKDQCPACARICPNVAIIFPKFTEAPINGSEITDEEEARAMVRLNMDKILGDNIYATLAERRRKAGKKRLIKQKKSEGSMSDAPGEGTGPTVNDE